MTEQYAAKERTDRAAHMASCPYCQIYLEQMRQTIRTLGCLPEERIPPKALDALLEHFRRWR